MDSKYFILILAFQFPNNPFFSETEAITTEKQSQATLFTSIPPVSTDSQNTNGNSSGQSTHFNNISSAKITNRQPTAVAYNSSGKPAVLTSDAYTTTRQPIPTTSNSFPQAVFSSVFPSTRLPRPHFYTPTQQPPLLANSSSEKPVLLPGHNLSTRPTPPVYLPSTISVSMNTPPFIPEPTNKKETPNKAKYNAIAATLIGVILICMLIAIIMTVLWKHLRKPALNDQNWAGRSPFADGETPDICMDNIRENEAHTKHTSVVSLMTWKPNKSTLLADDLEVKLFESSENIDGASNLKAENSKGKEVNGTSEDSADGSTIGTAISSSDDADLPLPPPLLDLEGQAKNQSDQLTMTTVTPLPNDFAHLQPSLACLNQTLEDSNSEIKQQFPPDSFNLPLPPTDFIENQDSTHEIQCQEFSIPPASDQDLTESLPPPPTDL
uniref:protein EVI2B n=1 Tax=Jaculus jaculus TaxID=51337 RepID=UPI001E1B07A5|nr:protein EVI2B [Jaculus jaculus]